MVMAMIGRLVLHNEPYKMVLLLCEECSGEISGKAMKAGTKFWHDHHFTCADCGIRLREAKVFQKDGRLYCDRDYKTKFVPRCAMCSEFILQVRSDLVIMTDTLV